MKCCDMALHGPGACHQIKEDEEKKHHADNTRERHFEISYSQSQLFHEAKAAFELFYPTIP